MGADRRTRVWEGGGAALIGGLGVLCALFLVHAASFPLGFGDVFWQIKTGELIWTQRSVPWHDPFAYTTAGKEWVEHEWLIDVGYYGLHQLGGLGAFRIFFPLLWLAGAGHLFFAVGRATGRPAIGLLAVMALIGLSARQFAPAPSTVSMFLLLATVLLLRPWDEAPGGPWRIGAAVALFYVWCNMHAVAMLVLGYLALYAGFPALPALVGSGRPRQRLADAWQALLRARGRWALLLSCTVVSFLTPYSYKIHMYALFGPSIAHDIDEWGTLFGSNYVPLWPKVIFSLICLGYLADLTGVLWRSGLRGWLRGPRGLFDVAALLSLALALRHARFIWLGELPLAVALCCGGAWLRRVPSLLWVPALGVGMAIAVRAYGWSPMHLRQMLAGRYYTAHLRERDLPVGAAGYLLAHPLSGNLYNHYRWGGYLIYRLYPHYRVFIDGRTVLHGADLVDEATRIDNGAPDTLAVLDKYDIRVLVVGANYFSGETARRLGWQLRFRDRSSAVYSR